MTKIGKDDLLLIDIKLHSIEIEREIGVLAVLVFMLIVITMSLLIWKLVEVL